VNVKELAVYRSPRGWGKLVRKRAKRWGMLVRIQPVSWGMLMRNPHPSWGKLVRNSPLQVGNARENTWGMLVGNDTVLGSAPLGSR
jgi:hypothetical protein